MLRGRRALAVTRFLGDPLGDDCDWHGGPSRRVYTCSYDNTISPNSPPCPAKYSRQWRKTAATWGQGMFEVLEQGVKLGFPAMGKDLDRGGKARRCVRQPGAWPQ